jgi:ATP adenylyltransferase
MERLHSPWRSQYIESFQDEPKTGCVFCDIIASNEDDKNLIIARGDKFCIIMNKYPYNSGHLMVISDRHIRSLELLDDSEKLTFIKYVEYSQKILQHLLNPDGFNIGLNIGRTAGAGIENHIHFHIVPRWNGDTNFMPVLADTKVISDDMHTQMLKLRKCLIDLNIKI